MRISVDQEKCDGCGRCVPICPFNAVVVDKGIATILESCTYCGACVEECPTRAIELEKEEFTTRSDSKGVWVFAEQRRGEIQEVTYELLAAARDLAQKVNAEVTAVLLGDSLGNQCDELVKMGADRVLVVEDQSLKDFQDDHYTDVISQLISAEKPEIFLAGGTTIGRSLLPRVAARVDTGLTADCTGLDIDEEKGLLLQTRPAFGGNLMATIICPEKRPQMATVRPKVMKKLVPDDGKSGEVLRKPFDQAPGDPRVKLLDFVEDVTQKVNIAVADVVVAGGRGLKSKENFALIEELADVLGGAVGASRATVDAGWIPYSHQVGQTGKTVCPKLYIAVGISGQIQHRVGMSSSEVIVAINKDSGAPIFDIADYGIVGDLFEVVPALTKAFKTLN
jgi:electron transfer flavoprotein alpha subunit